LDEFGDTAAVLEKISICVLARNKKCRVLLLLEREANFPFLVALCVFATVMMAKNATSLTKTV